MRRVAGAARAAWSSRRSGDAVRPVALPTDATRMRRGAVRGRNWRRIGLRRNQSRPTTTRIDDQ
jgi:CDP-diacylglycerol--serine O-phosphatidyltransferase